LSSSCYNSEEVVLHLRKEGKGVVRAADIEVSHDVEIINPEHIIAHLSAGGNLAMELKVEKSRGYRGGQPARVRATVARVLANSFWMPHFSPVRRVSYAVESARVEQRTDLDKLIMDIETNGAIEPEDAIRTAARILMEQLSVFADLAGTAMPIEYQKTVQVDPAAAASGG
jgi:DNA-directed RNA polymerase subunit alpha